MIGPTLSHYRIVEKLGAGGMGEVYRALDTRLNRTVAIKILRSDAASTAELRQRFEREARAIAALNHPHICTLYDVGREAETDFLVMEYCEGETLAKRLYKGPLPLEQVLRYGGEIVEALDKAHRAGIVHRDLKPGNIMLTKGGVKLLDFGLAKLRSPVAAAGERMTQATATEPLTAAGTILGTLHYMAPEQLEGKEAGPQADIFALGAVLYEMLSGRKAFDGASPASVISAVMTAIPKPITSLQPLTPPALDHLVTGCLAKDPEDRWQSAADIGRELRWIADRPPEPVGDTKSAAKRGRKAGALKWAAGIAIPVFLAGAVLSKLLWKSPSLPREVGKFILQLPADAPLAKPIDLPLGLEGPSLAISPDGRRIAYVAVHNGKRCLYVRQLEEFNFRQLKSTEDASHPFFSPDGEWLGFYSARKLHKVPFMGGAVTALCDCGFPFLGASWHRDGSIIFADQDGRVRKVNEKGGSPEKVSDPTSFGDALCYPSIQPDGRTVLATGNFTGDAKLLSLRSGIVKPISSGGGYPTLTSTGHLVTAGQGALFAAPFDAKNGKAGDAIRVLEDLRTSSICGAQYAFSETGTLVYALGGTTDESKLVMVDREGKAQDLGAPPGIYQHVAMAPKRDFLALNKIEGGRIDVYTLDLRRPSLLNRITSDGLVNGCPIWNSSGDKLVFHSDPDGLPKLWTQAADGNSAASPLLQVDRSGVPTDWSGNSLLFSENGKSSNWVLKRLEMGVAPQPRTLWDSGANSVWGLLSPDQQWLLYVSDKTGIAQIWIRPWPDMTLPEKQISIQGGSDPLWHPEGREIFYRDRNQFMKVAIPASLEGWIPKPELMFRKNYLNAFFKPWTIMPDGKHFIMLQPTHPDPPGTELHLVLNWFEELKQKVPVGR